MGVSVNSNISSLSAQRNLALSTRKLEASARRLSSGHRIASASDDAAGLALSERFRSFIRALNQNQRNANDAISMANTSDGALAEITSMLSRMRELAIQALNATNATTERTVIDNELQALTAEVQRIAKSTSFLGVPLLAGTVSSLDFQVGAFATTTDVIQVTAASTTLTALGIATVSVGTTSAARSAVPAIDAAINKVSTIRARFGAIVNRLERTTTAIAGAIHAAVVTESRIRDVDMAAETAEFTRIQVLQNAGVAILVQTNGLNKAALELLRF